MLIVMGQSGNRTPHKNADSGSFSADNQSNTASDRTSLVEVLSELRNLFGRLFACLVHRGASEEAGIRAALGQFVVLPHQAGHQEIAISVRPEAVCLMNRRRF